jgi:U3 small nucleolar RNA-associated protein 25
MPENANFYAEFVNMLVNGGGQDAQDNKLAVESNAIVSGLFTKYDALKLERVVGTKRVDRMLRSDKETFMFA